ncbi:MAG TPA: serine--tRNA ligase, partial [Firmicutes bacterium]|nr:serine--tRNA ligase [Candidatus Fermentithermobacillaceae bacterium]
MFDIEILRTNRAAVEEMLKKRSTEAPLDRILDLDRRRIELVRTVNVLREERNRLSEEIKG